MGLVQQFLKSFRQEDDLETGLFMKNDGTVWLRNPDGSETQLPGGGAGTVIQSPNDPGAVGAGVFWVNTFSFGGLAGTADRPLLVRNSANDDWIPVGLAHYDGDHDLRGFLTFTDGGMMIEQVNGDGVCTSATFFKNDGAVAFTLGFGLGGAPFKVQTGGSGYTWGVTADGSEFLGANAAPADGVVATSELLQWYDDTVGAPEHRFKAKDSAGTLVAGKVASLAPDGTAFLNVGKPTLDPATATPTQIVDALIALGLIQS